ncbi:MAG: type II toxin-antitoxin system VapC family toxin [Turicibacter sp.]|nr:type II toxin-antitoxin system VapC family toxin [Turicibacter sp.]
MTPMYVMDACALIAFLNAEEGARVVADILRDVRGEKAKITMHVLNLLEVYYGVYRDVGKEEAADMLKTAKQLPMTINYQIDQAFLEEAGRLKATHKISLADSIAVAQAAILGAKLLTSDHHELDVVEEKEPIEIVWIR